MDVDQLVSIHYSLWLKLINLSHSIEVIKIEWEREKKQFIHNSDSKFSFSIKSVRCRIWIWVMPSWPPRCCVCWVSSVKLLLFQHFSSSNYSEYSLDIKFNWIVIFTFSLIALNKIFKYAGSGTNFHLNFVIAPTYMKMLLQM